MPRNFIISEVRSSYPCNPADLEFAYVAQAILNPKSSCARIASGPPHPAPWLFKFFLESSEEVVLNILCSILSLTPQEVPLELFVAKAKHTHYRNIRKYREAKRT